VHYFLAADVFSIWYFIVLATEMFYSLAVALSVVLWLSTSMMLNSIIHIQQITYPIVKVRFYSEM